jgi:hypothetical protein
MSEQSEPTEIVQSSEPVAETVEAVETEVEQDAQPDEGEEPRKPRGVQKRIDELTGNWRSAERERDHWREVAMQSLQPVQQYVEPEPFYDEQGFYPDATQVQPLSPQSLLEQAKQLLRQEQEQQQIGQKSENFKASVSDPETLEFLNSPYAPISNVMAEIMIEHDAGPQIAGWLARNQSEAARIAKLPPHKQALELLKVSDKATAPKAVKTTSASAPVPTVGGRAAPDGDPSKMTTEQWMKWRQNQLKG